MRGHETKKTCSDSVFHLQHLKFVSHHLGKQTTKGSSGWYVLDQCGPLRNDIHFSRPDVTYWSQNSSNFSEGSLFRRSKCWFTHCKRKSSHVKYKTVSGCFFCFHQYTSYFSPFRNIYHSETAQSLLGITLWSFTTPDILLNI